METEKDIFVVRETPQQDDGPVRGKIGPEQLLEFLRILGRYKSGKGATDRRIQASENWWKLRNTREESKESELMSKGSFASVSGWLHNVITSKHADAMEAYPEPNILPREPSDQQEAKRLSSILPCILEQNNFEDTYSDAIWQKLKTGTGVYKVVWDSSKLNGLGDITVSRVNLLNLYWEPGVEDIQKSRYFFHTELCDKAVLEESYPEIKGKLKTNSFISSTYSYDDRVDTENKYTVIEVYYHRHHGGRRILHYCKFVGDQLLYATENDPQMTERGLYDHGRYPYEFDPLFPIEGSPCGYGFVDLCKNPQTEIDLLKTAFVKNAVQGATPRYFSRQDGTVNEKEFLDLSKPIVHVAGNLSEESLRKIDTVNLDGVYVNVMDRTIQELRETTGNTETAAGTAGSGVTAASAIAALQEASGKGSRDSTRGTYRCYTGIINLCIELIRQFYDLPRQFRILGEYGAQEFVSYSNAGIRPQHQGSPMGTDMGYRMPVFDIKVSAQKQNVYTKVSQNELAIQFFQLGFFNPQATDQALMTLQMMDFDGKDAIMQGIARNGTMFQKLQQYMQMAFSFAPDPVTAQMIAMDIQAMGGAVPQAAAPSASLPESDNIAGLKRREHALVRSAREKSENASQPGGGKVIKEREK